MKTKVEVEICDHEGCATMHIFNRCSVCRELYCNTLLKSFNSFSCSVCKDCMNKPFNVVIGVAR